MPLPHGLVVGQLVTGYCPDAYLQTAAEMRALSKARKNGDPSGATRPATKLVTADHYAFALWYEQRADSDERGEFADQAAFAMSSLGLLRDEQARALKGLGVDLGGNRVKLQQPRSGYWPDTLPMWLVALLHRIVEYEGLGGRQWRGRLAQLAKIMAVLWHSRRIDYSLGKPYGEFALDYLSQHAGIGHRGRTSEALETLERWGLVFCIHHGGKRGSAEPETSRYGLPIGITNNPAPLIFLPNQKPRSSTPTPQNAHPLAFTLGQLRETQDVFDLLSGTRYSLRKVVGARLRQDRVDFIEDTFRRRQISAEKWYGENRGGKAVVFPGAESQIIEATTILEGKAADLTIDRDYLERRQRKYASRLAKATSEPEVAKLQQRLRLVEAMLADGVCIDYDYTSTGRLAASPLPNPLNTSRDASRYGFDFWRALEDDLWAIDIRSADLLFGALLAGDKTLFDACLNGDLYLSGDGAQIVADALGRDLGTLGDAAEVRKVAKAYTIATSYGAGAKALGESDDRVSKKERQRFQDALKAQFPKFFDWVAQKRQYGREAYRHGWQPRLPNGFRMVVSPGDHTPAGYGAPACFVQATVKVAATRLLLELERRGHDPVFEIHDAVVVRQPVPAAEANAILWDVIASMAETLGRGWHFDRSLPVVKIEPVIEQAAARHGIPPNAKGRASTPASRRTRRSVPTSTAAV